MLEGLRERANASFARGRVRLATGVRDAAAALQDHARTLAHAYRRRGGVDLALFVARKYSLLDTFAPFLAWLRARHPELRIVVYLCCSAEEALLRDRFFSRMFAELRIEHHALGDDLRGAGWLLPGVLAATRPRAVVVDDRLLWGAQHEWGYAPLAEALLGYLRRSGQPLLIRHHGLLQWPVLYDAPLPAFEGLPYEYWFSQTEALVPLRGRLAEVPVRCLGSPGYDAWWLDERRRLQTPRERPVCLYLTRSFVPDGTPRRMGDLWVGEMRAVTRAMFVTSGMAQRWDFLVKPYPTVSDQLVAQVVQGVLPRYRVEWSSVHSLLGGVDLVVGEGTSAMWVPFLAGIPCLVEGFSMLADARRNLSSPHDADYVGRFEPALYGLLDRPEDCAEAADALVDGSGRVRPEAEPRIAAGVAAFRAFFPDGACERTYERLREMIPGWP